MNIIILMEYKHRYIWIRNTKSSRRLSKERRMQRKNMAVYDKGNKNNESKGLRSRHEGKVTKRNLKKNHFLPNSLIRKATGSHQTSIPAQPESRNASVIS